MRVKIVRIIEALAFDCAIQNYSTIILLNYQTKKLSKHTFEKARSSQQKSNYISIVFNRTAR